MVSAGIQIASFLLKGLDLLVWLLTFGPVWMAIKQNQVPRLFASPVGEAKCNGSLPGSKIFRSRKVVGKDLYQAPLPGVETLYDLVKRAYDKYGDKPALGTRRFLEAKMIEGVRFPTKVFGPTTWRSFKQVGIEATNFGSGLRKLGISPLHIKEGLGFSEVEGDHCILMYEDTCAEWLIAMQGAHSQSMVVATAYATLGPDSIVQAVNEANISTVFCNYKSVEGVLKQKDKMPSLRNIIYTTLFVPPGTDKHPGQDPTIKVYSFQEVVDMGAEAKIPPSPPRDIDVAILMYTSGSTGKPKGVMVRHKQIVCLFKGVQELTGIQEEKEVLVAFLPLAHIFEMQMECFIFGYGGQIGYADPKTLVAGPGKCEPTGALQEFRPTLMGAVPKVWEVIKSGAEAKIKAGGEAKEFLFKTALEWKKAAMPAYRETPVFDALVFSKIKATLGGRLRLAVSGGGAISTSVQEWVRTCIGCPLVQGYGLTETCAGLTVQDPRDWRTGIVGAPTESVEVILHSEPEICDSDNHPYLATDTKHFGVACVGRGEIWVRGNNVTDGYYKMPKETEAEFDKDGWFHTGDIGIMLPDGVLKIVDRKKNLVKLKGGEYIALERMNQAYNTCPLVDTENGGSCSYGDGDMDRPVALVQVNQKMMLEAAKELGLSSTNPEELVKDPKMIEHYTKTLNATGKKVDPPLSSLETLASVALLLQPWSPNDGTLTASLKIVPKRIQMAFAAELEAVKPKGIRG